MKKYPRWAFLAVGVVITVAALYLYGKHKMKKDAAAAAAAKGTSTPAATEAAKTLTGPVIRVN
jgi:hypothetical protein